MIWKCPAPVSLPCPLPPGLAQHCQVLPEGPAIPPPPQASCRDFTRSVQFSQPQFPVCEMRVRAGVFRSLLRPLDIPQAEMGGRAAALQHLRVPCVSHTPPHSLRASHHTGPQKPFLFPGLSVDHTAL